MKGPDEMPAPARDAHRHECGDWCFCFIPRDADCETCGRRKANQRMREDYEDRREQSRMVGI